jgi:hypothetical protein
MRARETIEQEMQWAADNYRLDRPLIRKCLIIALEQKIKVNKEPDRKEFWRAIIDKLKSIQ